MSELGERLTIGVTKTYKELQEMVISFVANREGSKEIILCFYSINTMKLTNMLLIGIIK